MTSKQTASRHRLSEHQQITATTLRHSYADLVTQMKTCRFTVSAEKTKTTKRATSVRGKDSFDLLQVDVRRACQLVHVRRLSELFSAHLVSLYSTATTQQIRTSISRNGFTAVVDKCSRDGSITTRAILVRKKSNRQALRRHLLPTAGPDGRFYDRVRKDGATARHRIVRLRDAATRNHAHSSKQVVELRQRKQAYRLYPIILNTVNMLSTRHRHSCHAG